jgi:hypothetical protein
VIPIPPLAISLGQPSKRSDPDDYRVESADSIVHVLLHHMRLGLAVARKTAAHELNRPHQRPRSRDAGAHPPGPRLRRRHAGADGGPRLRSERPPSTGRRRRRSTPSTSFTWDFTTSAARCRRATARRAAWASKWLMGTLGRPGRFDLPTSASGKSHGLRRDHGRPSFSI